MALWQCDVQQKVVYHETVEAETWEEACEKAIERVESGNQNDDLATWGTSECEDAQMSQPLEPS
tara:strand:- start:1556 stop:1747 length:192 start_codon:yes stop_codon:yes gene_type:complete